MSAMGWKRARGSFEVEMGVKGREESVEREGEKECRQSERNNKSQIRENGQDNVSVAIHKKYATRK